METNHFETKATDTLKHSPYFLRNRKFLLLLPLMVIPCLAAIFASFGGGKNISSSPGAHTQKQGLNTLLPDARFKHSRDKDKLETYEEALKDSQRLLAARKKDPFFKDDSSLFTRRPQELERLFENAKSRYAQQANGKLNGMNDPDGNAQKVMDKLTQLKSALAQKTDVPRVGPKAVAPADRDIGRLNELMKRVENKSSGTDPELNQIGGLLDKLIDVQHPERLQDSMARMLAKNKQPIFSVSANDYGQAKTENGFYNASPPVTGDTLQKENAILAVIEGDQTIVSGAIVKLRLLQNIYVHGVMVPKDALISGISSLSGERVRLTVTSIRNAESIFPVSLEAYDMDGLAGIYVPGSIDRDVSKQSADEAIGAIGLTTLDPSFGAQAASAGIQAAKTLISKKVKLVRVSIRSGYRVLLKDNSQH